MGIDELHQNILNALSLHGLIVEPYPNVEYGGLIDLGTYNNHMIGIKFTIEDNKIIVDPFEDNKLISELKEELEFTENEHDIVSRVIECINNHKICMMLNRKI